VSIDELPDDFKIRWLDRIDQVKDSLTVGVYTGHGMDATPFFPVQLKKLGFDVVEFDYKHPEKIEGVDVIIFPGGHYMPFDWSDGTADKFAEFVSNGGGFISVCLGSFVAKEIGLITEELEPINFTGLIDTEITDRRVFRYGKNVNNIKLLHMNGRDLAKPASRKEITPIIVHDDIVLAGVKEFGKGKAVLFSSHPEGGKFEYANNYIILEGYDLGTYDLLLDAIFYVTDN
jgi:hypothetical protein